MARKKALRSGMSRILFTALRSRSLKSEARDMSIFTARDMIR